MFISRYGNGPRTYLGIHGWSGDHRAFLPIVASLPEDATFYAVDLPGCGQSADPTVWSLEAVVGSIAEAARAIPASFTLIGHCSGALLGMLAAQQLHGRIERMLLLDVFAEWPWYFRIFLTPLVGPLAYYSTFANPIGRWLTDASLREHRTPETSLTSGFSQIRHASVYRYLRLLERFPAPETFRDLTMPVDLIYGANTFAAVAEAVPRWQAVWPQARAIRLDGAAHLPMEEAAGALRDILFKEGSLLTECPIPSPTIAG